MKIGDIVYLGEPKEWYKTPNNFNEMIIYPAGTPVKIIGGIKYVELTNKPVLVTPSEIIINQEPFYSKFLNKKRKRK